LALCCNKKELVLPARKKGELSVERGVVEVSKEKHRGGLVLLIGRRGKKKLEIEITITSRARGGQVPCFSVSIILRRSRKKSGGEGVK